MAWRWPCVQSTRVQSTREQRRALYTNKKRIITIFHRGKKWTHHSPLGPRPLTPLAARMGPGDQLTRGCATARRLCSLRLQPASELHAMWVLSSRVVESLSYCQGRSIHKLSRCAYLESLRMRLRGAYGTHTAAPRSQPCARRRCMPRARARPCHSNWVVWHCRWHCRWRGGRGF